MKTWILMSLLVPLASFAQSTTSFYLSQEAMRAEAHSPEMSRIDLIKAASRMGQAHSLEIQAVKVEASTGVGGAQVFLRINNEFVDSESLESMRDNEVVKAELKNIERAALQEASLVLQGANNLKLKSVEIVLGQVSEPVLFGRYNEEAIQQVAQAGSTGGRPSAAVTTGLYQKYYLGETPTQVVGQTQVIEPSVQPQPQPQPVPQRRYMPMATTTTSTTTTTTAPSRCVTNRRGEILCIGDRVINRVFIEGTVKGLDRSTNPTQLIILFDLSEGTVRRNADSVRKK